MNSNKEKLLAVWLVPAKKEYDLLLEIIHKLSKQFNSCCFEPHITLYATKAPRTGDHKQLLNYIKQIIFPISLNVFRLEQSKQFTKTLYITFNESRQLSEITSMLTSKFNADNFPYSPHLSLLYSSTSKKNRNMLLKNIVLPFNHIAFDVVKFIEAHIPIESNCDVENWKIIYELQM